MTMRKPITITLPADEALLLTAMLMAVEAQYEANAVSGAMDADTACLAAALASEIRRQVHNAMADQMTMEEARELEHSANG